MIEFWKDLAIAVIASVIGVVLTALLPLITRRQSQWKRTSSYSGDLNSAEPNNSQTTVLGEGAQGNNVKQVIDNSRHDSSTTIIEKNIRMSEQISGTGNTTVDDDTEYFKMAAAAIGGLVLFALYLYAYNFIFWLCVGASVGLVLFLTIKAKSAGKLKGNRGTVSATVYTTMAILPTVGQGYYLYAHSWHGQNLAAAYNLFLSSQQRAPWESGFLEWGISRTIAPVWELLTQSKDSLFIVLGSLIITMGSIACIFMAGRFLKSWSAYIGFQFGVTKKIKLATSATAFSKSGKKDLFGLFLIVAVVLLLSFGIGPLVDFMQSDSINNFLLGTE